MANALQLEVHICSERELKNKKMSKKEAHATPYPSSGPHPVLKDERPTKVNAVEGDVKPF
eukprot:1892076-Amphidinium_carterae.1